MSIHPWLAQISSFRRCADWYGWAVASLTLERLACPRSSTLLGVRRVYGIRTVHRASLTSLQVSCLRGQQRRPSRGSVPRSVGMSATARDWWSSQRTALADVRTSHGDPSMATAATVTTQMESSCGRAGIQWSFSSRCAQQWAMRRRVAPRSSATSVSRRIRRVTWNCGCRRGTTSGATSRLLLQVRAPKATFTLPRPRRLMRTQPPSTCCSLPTLHRHRLRPRRRIGRHQARCHARLHHRHLFRPHLLPTMHHRHGSTRQCRLLPH